MVTDTYSRIGKRVKEYRKQRGFSQDELAEGICSRQTISLLENGQHFPSVEFMQKIAGRLSIPLYEIMLNESKELESKIQLDMISVYIECGDFNAALEMVEGLDRNPELLEYQRRELVLSWADCLIKTNEANVAVEKLTQLQQHLEQQRESDDHLMAAVYDKLGTACFVLSNVTNAHAHYQRAFQISLRFSEFDLVAARISYNFGKINRMLGRSVDAVEYLSRAEGFFNRVADQKRQALTMFELGIAYKNRGELEKAAEYLNESRVLYKSLNLESMARRVRESYAYNVLSKQNPDQAIQELLACVSEFDQNQETVSLVYAYARVARLFLDEKRVADAKDYLNKALTLFDEDKAQSDPRFAFVYQSNAEYLFEIKEYEKCAEFSFKSSEIFDKMGLDRNAADALTFAVQAYRTLGMVEIALDLSEKVCGLLSRSLPESNWYWS